jgi:shikimate dehydrogenase
MISGRTSILPLLGIPTHSFKAPMIYNPWFDEAGVDAVVVPMGVTAERFPALLRELLTLTNLGGVMVTMPHKISTVSLADDISTTAAVAGAANALRLVDGRLVADMFDGEGFVAGMRRHGHDPAGAAALVVGAGGVGSAIAASLAAAGIARLGLADVRPSAAEGLAARVRHRYPALDVRPAPADPASWDVVVNATPLGMDAGDPLPLDPDRLKPGTFVGEVVLSREVTPLVAAAAERGCPTQVGIDMLFEQVPAYLEFFGLPTTTADHLREIATIRY